MSKKRVDPFASSNTVPERGTGLSIGTAGERREGDLRTESERVERHDSRVVNAEIPLSKNNSLPNGTEITIKDGVTYIWHKGKELPDISKMKEYKPESITTHKRSSIEKSWDNNRDSYYLKKK